MLRLKMYIIQYVLNITIVMVALTKVLSKPGLLLIALINKKAADAAGCLQESAPNGGSQIRINPYLNSPCKSSVSYHIFNNRQ